LIKKEIDLYYCTYYSTLIKTSNNIIQKYKRNVNADDLVSASYEYSVLNQDKIIDFAIKYHKTIDHAIYAFVKRYLSTSMYWGRSVYLLQHTKLSKRIVELDKVNETCSSINISNDNIYSEEFIEDFYNTLSKLDKICFEVYYYKNINTGKDLAAHLNLNRYNAYEIINNLKLQLNNYIKIRQII